jgi:hypothetical protein
MPEQLTKYPDVTITVLKSAGAKCGEEWRARASPESRWAPSSCFSSCGDAGGSSTYRIAG